MGNFFSDLFSDKEPGIVTKPIIDTDKKAVSDPLSAYLASSIGSGLPRYSGELGASLPEGGGASVNPFLKMSVDNLYGGIKNNAVAEFKNNYSDLLENSAGALSSSNRAYNDKTALTSLELGLADKRAALELGLPAAQYDIASKMQDAQTKNNVLQYQDWYKSLPEMNPLLDKALTYLQNSTGTGTTVLTALDPGKKAGIWDFVNAGIQGLAAFMGGSPQAVNAPPQGYSNLQAYGNTGTSGTSGGAASYSGPSQSQLSGPLSFSYA